MKDKIKHPDLRINSYYKLEHQTFVMDMRMMFAFCGKVSYEIDLLEGIPLTPEILIGMGFEQKYPRSEDFFENKEVSRSYTL